MWAKIKGEEPGGKVYEEHKLILELLEQQPCVDCVSRQAVLDKKELVELEDGQSFYCISPENVKKLPPVIPQQTRWIPVSERLPESDVDVLTQYSDYSMSVDFRTASSSGWFWADEDLPIAWMPLPEPYKAESEDEE